MRVKKKFDGAVSELTVQIQVCTAVVHFYIYAILLHIYIHLRMHACRSCGMEARLMAPARVYYLLE